MAMRSKSRGACVASLTLGGLFGLLLGAAVHAALLIAEDAEARQLARELPWELSFSAACAVLWSFKYWAFRQTP